MTLRAVVLGFACMLMAGCAGSSIEPRCLAGATLECTCADGRRGSQTCSTTRAWAACDCAGYEVAVSTPVEFAETGTAESDAAASHEIPTQAAKQRLTALWTAAQSYWQDDDNFDGTGGARQYPASSAGPTPKLGTCCRSGGTCEPDQAYWQEPVWLALQFRISAPQHFSYEYVAAEDLRSFTARAIGDLDCDGTYTTYEVRGSPDEKATPPEIEELLGNTGG